MNRSPMYIVKDPRRKEHEEIGVAGDFADFITEFYSTSEQTRRDAELVMNPDDPNTQSAQEENKQ